MIQPDRDPAAAPQAIPILGYEAHSDDSSAIWVIRFVGASIINYSAAEVVSRAYRLYHDWASGFSWHGIGLDADLFSALAAIPLGFAIIDRRRIAFYGILALLVILPFGYVVPRVSIMTIEQWLIQLPQMIVVVGAIFAALLSVLRHANAKGALWPVRTNYPCESKPKDSFDLIASRIGWICLGVLSQLPLRGRTLADWRFAAYAMCGVLLCAKQRWAIWLLAAILPLGLYAQLMQYLPGTFLPWNLARSSVSYALSVIMDMGGLATVTQTCLLCLLAHRAGRSMPA